jgi:hypothetical protein
VRVVRAVFPRRNDWLNRLPDPRAQELCLYAAAHLWWQIIATFLSRKGSRNGYDEQRQAGAAAWNMGALCGQTAEDPRFAGAPTVTCSDNAAHHASRVDSEQVARIPVPRSMSGPGRTECGCSVPRGIGVGRVQRSD